jgi:hypothetical protein
MIPFVLLFGYVGITPGHLFYSSRLQHQQEPDNPSPNDVRQLHDYSAIIEVWEELASRVKSPAEFLPMWYRVEDYKKYVRNAVLDSIYLPILFSGSFMSFGFPSAMMRTQ